MAAAVWYLASSSLLNELMNERPPRWWKGRGGDVLTMFQGSDGGGGLLQLPHCNENSIFTNPKK